MGEQRQAVLTEQQTKAAILLGRGLRIDEIVAQLGIPRPSLFRELREAKAMAGARTNTHLAVMVALRRQELQRERGVEIQGQVQ